MLKRTRSRVCIGFLVVLIGVIVVVRLYMSVWLLDYVNKTLSDLNGYHGSIKELHIHLYRGAYDIEGLVITKQQGKFYAPFISADKIDLSLHWAALFHGRLVGNVHITGATANFAIDKTGTQKQTGAEIDWTKKVKDLLPININEITLKDSKVAYKDFSSTPNVDIYMTQMNGEIHNLRNVTDKDKPLPSAFELHANSIGHGKFAMAGKANILKKVPDVDMGVKLEDVDLPAINSYSEAYGAIDFKSGKLSVYSEFVLKNEHLKGYVKPIASDISLVDLTTERNPFKILWESFVSGLIQIFKNQGKDQFATKVEFEGHISNINTDTWGTVVNIFHNAFVHAFDKKLDHNVAKSKPEDAPVEP